MEVHQIIYLFNKTQLLVLHFVSIRIINSHI